MHWITKHAGQVGERRESPQLECLYSLQQLLTVVQVTRALSDLQNSWLSRWEEAGGQMDRMGELAEGLSCSRSVQKKSYLANLSALWH